MRFGETVLVYERKSFRNILYDYLESNPEYTKDIAFIEIKNLFENARTCRIKLGLQTRLNEGYDLGISSDDRNIVIKDADKSKFARFFIKTIQGLEEKHNWED